MIEKELFNDIMIAIDEEDIKYLIRDKYKYKPIIEALNRLEELERDVETWKEVAEHKEEEYQICHEECERLTSIKNKQAEILRIIKEKKVNVRAFLKCCNSEDGLSIYNNQCDDKQEKESKELTQEEFDLLKEVLK